MVQGEMKMRTKTLRRLLIALVCAGSISAAYAQNASGLLYVHVSVESSYYLEVKGEGYTSTGQGRAVGNSLQAPVRPGLATVRVLKANSDSGKYSLFVSGGKNDLRMGDLPYDTTIPVNIPDSNPSAALMLFVVPD
jgi:hypothetical protein